MAVARLGTPVSNQGSATLSFTVPAGTNRLLVVCATDEDGQNTGTLDSVDYGGQAMVEAVQLRTANSGFSASASIWYLLDDEIAAASGTTITTTYSEAINEPHLHAMAFEGVDQTGGSTTNPATASARTNASTPNPLILDLTEADEGCVVAAAACGNATFASWTSGDTIETTEEVDGSSVGTTSDRLSTTAANINIEPAFTSQNRTAGVSATFAPAASGPTETTLTATATSIATLARKLSAFRTLATATVAATATLVDELIEAAALNFETLSATVTGVAQQTRMFFVTLKPPITAPAIDFDGATTTGYDIANSNTGLADTGMISCSFWLRRDSGAAQNIVHADPSFRTVVSQQSDNRLDLIFKNPSGTTQFAWISNASDLPAQAAWQHVALYVDLATLDDFGIFIDATEIIKAATTFNTGGTIDHTNLGIALGNEAGLGAATALDGGLSQFALWPRKIDWGDPATLALVRTASGEAVILPDDGDIDGGGAADYVFNKSLGSSNINGGNANDWAAPTTGLSNTVGPEVITGTATFLSKAMLFRLFSETITGSALLARKLNLFRAFSATSIGTATLNRLLFLKRAFDATATGVATLIDTFIGGAQLFLETVSATVTGAATLLRRFSLVRIFDATITGVATFIDTFVGAAQLFFETVSAVVTGSATLDKVATLFRSMDATVIGVAQQIRMFFVTLKPTGTVPAVGFPGGTNEGFQDSNTNTGLADGKQLSYSFWARRAAATNFVMIALSANVRLGIQITSLDRLQITYKDSGAANVFFWDTASGAFASDDVWRHWCGYIDTATLNDFDNFRNGASLGESAITFVTDGVIDFTDSGIVVGEQNNGNNVWNGGLSQLAIWPRKIDWSDSANLALVRTVDGKAVVLPDDGNIDGLGDANFVFNKPLATAHQNGGTADDWATATSGLTDIPGPGATEATLIRKLNLFRIFSGTAIGVATLNRLASLFRTFSAAVTGLATLAAEQIVLGAVILSATVTGVATMVTRSIFARVFSGTATGVAFFFRTIGGVNFYEFALSATASTALVFDKLKLGALETFSATVTNVATFARRLSLSRVLSVSRVISAVRYDGLTTRTDGTALAANGDVISGSFWVRRTRSGVLEQIMDGASGRFSINLTVTDLPEMVFTDTAGSTNITLRGSAITDTIFHHIGFTVENGTSTGTGTGTGVLFVDGVDDTTIITNTIGTNDFDTNQIFSLGADQGALTSMFNGDLADFWIAAEKIDWPDEIGKFYSGGSPVGLNDDGSRPTGNQPILYLNRPAGSWEVNSGSHANLSPFGALEDATGPGAYSAASMFLPTHISFSAAVRGVATFIDTLLAGLDEVLLSAQATGVATMNRLLLLARTFAAVVTGSATLNRLLLLFRTFAASVTGLATIVVEALTVALTQVTLAATATGVATLQRLVTFLRTLLAPVTGSASLLLRRIFSNISIAATATGAAVLNKFMFLRRVFSVTATATVALFVFTGIVTEIILSATATGIARLVHFSDQIVRKFTGHGGMGAGDNKTRWASRRRSWTRRK